jgi:uridylate kinase
LKVIVKLGGHLFPDRLDTSQIIAYSKVIMELHALGHQIVIVIGGGRVARKYIDAARTLGASEFICDVLGIAISRVNAQLFITSLGDIACPQPVTSLKQALMVSEKGRIIVLGGLYPGQSTNAVAGLVAEAYRADLLVNATDVDGVYSADPDEAPHAKKLDQISPENLRQLLLSKSSKAGDYALFDPVAIKIIERSRIQTRIIDGRDPDNIIAAVQGKAIGTLIVSPKTEGQMQ